MKNFLFILFLLHTLSFYGQQALPEKYGFSHLQTTYKADPVHILIKSKKGEEQKKKPLLLFCQGSLPIPLMIQYDRDGRKGIYNVFPFNPDSLSKDYHVVIIAKPYVPLTAEERSLAPDLSYKDSTGKFPQQYIERNLLDYYVKRNIHVLRFLQKQPWASRDQLVVAGHSEGSTIAARIASGYKKVSQLIYSGGNPLGRMMTLVSRERANEKDSSKGSENIFQYWKDIVADPDKMNAEGDTNKGMFQFSSPPPIEYLKKLKIPVLVTYGTKDHGLIAAADYCRLEMIRLNKLNITFKSYAGTDHNFFPVKANGDINYDIFNWDKVAEDWRAWLKGK